MTDPKRGRGRPRREGADAEILAVTLELLRQTGYRDFNVDVVAERTGIAKTTIYRRWPTKDALIGAAIGPVLAEAATALRAADARALPQTIAPHRAALAALVGSERADELLGAIIVRLLSGEDIQ